MNPKQLSLWFLVFSLAVAPSSLEAENQLGYLRDLLAKTKPYEMLELRPNLPIPSRHHKKFFEFSIESSYFMPIESFTSGVLLVGPWNSLLLIFDSKGCLKTQLELPDLDSVQTLDIDSDGKQEILVDQVDGHGTGILFKKFHLYSARDQSIDELWSGLSFERVVNYLSGPKPNLSLAVGLVKFEPGAVGSEIPPRLLHFIEKHKGDGKEPTVERRVYTLKPGAKKLEEIPWPGESTTYTE
jgi:hypothetical protein